MSLKYLNLSGLEDLWINIKNYILSKVPTKTSELTNDSGYLTSHQSLSNYVTLNTVQEITSTKTFKNATVRKLTSVEAGNVIPTSDKLISDVWQDKNGKELGRIYYSKTKGGNTALIMRAGDWFTSNDDVYTLDASGTNRRAELHLYTDSSGNCCIKPVGYFSATLKPLSSSVWLGESTNPFGYVYANQFRMSNPSLEPNVDVQTNEDHSIGFFGKNSIPLSYITFQKRTGLADRIAVRIQTASSAYKSYCFDANCLYPEVDNSLDIGSSSKIFKNIYCNNYYLGTTAFGDIVTHNASEFLTSHQSLANYALDANVVHTSGNETVSGKKTFTNDIVISKNASNMAIFLQNLSYDPKTNGQSGIEGKSCGINFLTSTGDPYININAYGLGDRTLLRFTNSYFTDSQNIDYDSVEFSIYGNGARSFRPKNTSNCDLGESNKQWKGVYATNYYYGSNNVEFSTKFVTTDTAQTISGNKTFSNNVNVYNSDSATDTANIILKNSKAERGSTTNIGEQTIFFLDKNNAQIGHIKCNVDSNGYSNLTLHCSDTNDTSSGVQVRKTATGITFQPTLNGQCYLGQSIRRWFNTYTSRINGVEPSSLSLPSGNVSDFIDISSYFSNTGAGDTNSYTALANGWIYLRLGDITSCQVVLNDSSNRRLWGTSATGNVEQIIMPVLKNTTLTTTWITNSTVNVATARFIPCQGNI